MNKTIKLSIPNDKTYVTIIRLTAASLANLGRFSLEEIDDIKMSVAEASIYLLNPDSKENLETSFEFTEKYLKITIIGSGGSENVDSLGLQIIKALMDDVEVISERIVMTKYLKGEADGK